MSKKLGKFGIALSTRSENVSDGYAALWERKRLDLTVEALILRPEWLELFSELEREIARQRLAEYGYDVGGISS